MTLEELVAYVRELRFELTEAKEEIAALRERPASPSAEWEMRIKGAYGNDKVVTLKKVKE